jgi:hypothetical protein
MIEFTDGKWECDECGDWWADVRDTPTVCGCEADVDDDAEGAVYVEGDENGSDI